MIELERYVEGLTISQGAGLDAAFKLLPWERRFLRGAFARGVQTAAVTLARGGGKSTLSAAVAAATLNGPLVQRRAETIVVASSFGPKKHKHISCGKAGLVLPLNDELDL